MKILNLNNTETIKIRVSRELKNKLVRLAHKRGISTLASIVHSLIQREIDTAEQDRDIKEIKQ